jgi:transcription elongation factor Elf1
MTVEKVTNPKVDKTVLRCASCGNKDIKNFKANSKTHNIECEVCGKAVLQGVENPELYRQLGGK